MDENTASDDLELPTEKRNRIFTEVMTPFQRRHYRDSAELAQFYDHIALWKPIHGKEQTSKKLDAIFFTGAGGRDELKKYQSKLCIYIVFK